MGSIFNEVLDRLLRLYPEVVRPPQRTEIPKRIASDERLKEFKGCVGALDGTHLDAHVLEHQKRRFRNRHGYITQNVLAAVDFRMRFTYVLPGWEGSAYDGRVIKDAVRRGFKPPPGCYYLADAGYSNTDMWLTPYRGVRYHLREIRTAAKKPEDKYELFNHRHSSLRNGVERTFGIFKRRWRIYDRAPEFPFIT